MVISAASVSEFNGLESECESLLLSISLLHLFWLAVRRTALVLSRSVMKAESGLTVKLVELFLNFN